MRLITFISKRIGLSLFALFGLSILIFSIARVLPGDPARMALGPRAPEYTIKALREELHLDEPVYIQYYYWLQDLFNGKLGRSLSSQRDVLDDIKGYLPATLELVVFAGLLEVALAITLGITAGRHPNTWIDTVVRMCSYAWVAVPSFVFGIIFLLVLGHFWPVFPRMGRLSAGVSPPPVITGFITIDSLLTFNLGAFADALWHLFLPGLSMCLGGMAQDARITRASVIENLNKDYILSATSRGIPERKIMLKYLLKPSLIPTVSVMALDIASLIGGSFLIEVIFGWPGFSRYGLTAMMSKDLNAIVGTVLVVGLVFALTNIIVDVTVAYLDPRIRTIERAK